METSENLFGCQKIRVGFEIDSTLIFEGIKKEEEEYLSEEDDGTDSTDEVLDLLATLFKQVQEEFDKLLDGNSGKKRFIKALTLIKRKYLPCS